MSLAVEIRKPEREVASAFFALADERLRLRAVRAELPTGSDAVARAIAAVETAMSALADLQDSIPTGDLWP